MNTSRNYLTGLTFLVSKISMYEDTGVVRCTNATADQIGSRTGRPPHQD